MVACWVREAAASDLEIGKWAQLTSCTSVDTTLGVSRDGKRFEIFFFEWAGDVWISE